MKWQVIFHEDFEKEFQEFPLTIQDEILTLSVLLEKLGPQLNRPHVDTLKGSSYANMKELRFKADHGVWRVAFAFDPKRQAILLVAGNKSKTSEKRFYQKLITKADQRFQQYLNQIKP
jgi:hypothetical protein